MTGDAVLTEISDLIRNLADRDAVISRVGGDEFALIVCDAASSQLVAHRICRALSENDLKSIPERLTVSAGVATYPADALSKDELLQIADFAMYQSKEKGKNRVTVYTPELGMPSTSLAERQLRQEYLSAVLAITSAIDVRSRDIFDHCRNVSRYAVQVAENMNLSPGEVEVVRLGGLLHDIGKIGVPDRILNKPGALTEDEMGLIHEHPLHARVLAECGIPQPIVDSILCHHERPDGLGYPRGLHAESIPLAASIIKVADALDAMASTRPYRPALPMTEVLRILKSGRGTEFDPRAVDSLLDVMRREAFVQIPQAA